jgi:RHS repeat-associated protein
MSVSARMPRLTRLAALFAAVTLPVAATAQSVPSAYTSATRYDIAGHVTGTIAPDPDGAGPLHYAAVRNTYDSRGNLTKVETGELSSWQSEAVAPSAWSGFTIYTTTLTTYDALDRKATVAFEGSDLVAVSLTQYSYDSVGRLECTAVRMNPAVYASLPPSACTPGTAGSYGPDRITRNLYDDVGQVVQVREGVGSGDEGSEATYSYTPNGKKKYVVDANGNKAELRYDGYDRQVRWVFPSSTRAASFDDSSPASALASAGALNESDYEAYTYDANGNRLTLKKRDNRTITYAYDLLNRVTSKTYTLGTGATDPSTRPVYYGYDARGLQTKARFDSLGGEGDTNVYDGFGRITSAAETLDSTTRQLSYLYDRDGDRTRITHPDNAYFTYAYDGVDRPAALADSSGNNLVQWTFKASGVLQSAAHYGAAQDIVLGHDEALRNDSYYITNNASPQDVVWFFHHNPAGQVTQEDRDKDAYAWTGQANVTRNYTTNGLNQYTADSSATYGFDANGNLTGASHVADGAGYYDDFAYTYDAENRLISAVWTDRSASGNRTVTTTLKYDPAGRLHQVSDSVLGTTRFLYDGDALVGEYNGSGTMLARYAHGADAEADDPQVSYTASSTALGNARFLYPDRHGSIVLRADTAGTSTAINTYDEYGIPSLANVGRFQYTGQAWLPELGLYYYKARLYSPTLGRFLQTDPIGYADQVNLYAYVGDDPVDGMDPSGAIEQPGSCTGSLTCNGADPNVPGSWTASPGLTTAELSPDNSDPAKDYASQVGKAMDDSFAQNEASYNASDPTNGDNELTLNEANLQYRHGNGATVNVDASKLKIVLYEEAKKPGQSVGGFVAGSAYWVHGQVAATLQSNGTYRIVDAPYDFDIKPQLKETLIGRNLGARVGESIATRGGRFAGKPFMIHYYGTPAIVR